MPALAAVEPTAMADPHIKIAKSDIRFEERSGSFVLVDPVRDDVPGDVAVCWKEGADRWRWRSYDHAPDGSPYPSASDRYQALEAMISHYSQEPGVAQRLSEQRPRFSMGMPQIFRA